MTRFHRTTKTIRRSMSAAAALAALAALCAAQQAPFDIVDDVEASWVNLNFQTVRPIALVPKNAGGEKIWAVNTQDSTALRFPTTTATGANLEVRVPWGPVAIAHWDAGPFAVIQPADSDPMDQQPIPTAIDAIDAAPTPANFPSQILVVSKGSRVLTYLDERTGAVLRMKELPDEPGDIVVVRDRAFIACAAEDVVVEVNLVSNTIVGSYPIPGKHPLYLSVETHPGNVTTILVTPMLSGNNSTPENLAGARRAAKIILDLEDPDVAQTPLPDEDTFRIDPVANTVTPVLTDAGTILFGNGLNPATGDFWILNTESLNKDPENQTEPSIAGFIATDRLSIASLPPFGSSAPLEPPHRVVELDDTNHLVPGIQYDPATRAVGMPYALAFDSAGRGWATSIASDTALLLSSNGDVRSQIRLPDGFAPRGVAVTADDSQVLVWSQNQGEIRVYGTKLPHPLVAVHELGYDPTPELVAEGRELFYDGKFSLNDNATCGTCHIDGRFDLLTWQLSAGHSDIKGPMFTQTLVGIEKLAPYHWRGERADLIDFNGAFEGLLGGRELTEGPGGEFEAFQAFVFSLQSSPNPNQHTTRLLDDSIQPPRLPNGVVAASAVNGQTLFNQLEVVGDMDCNECHTLPTGTNNDLFADDITGKLPHRTHFKVTPFNGQWRKHQPLVFIELVEDGVVQPPEEQPLLGAGVSHAGRVDDVLAFLDDATNVKQEQADVTSFLNQLDQGIAPVVSRAWLLTPSTQGTVVGQIQTELMPQAGTNCDVIVYGLADLGTTTPMRWWWDDGQSLFLPEDSTVTARTLQDFIDNAAQEANVFEAVPLGSGERHGIDFDNDGLPNLDELVAGTDPFDPDFDDDGFPDGHEVANGGNATSALTAPTDGTDPTISGLDVPWHTARVARLRFETDEPTRYVITYTTTAPPPFDGGVVTSDAYERTHSLLLRHLNGSTLGGPQYTYDVTVEAFDPQGNSSSAMIQFTTNDLTRLTDKDCVVGDLERRSLRVVDGSDLELTVRFRVDDKLGGYPRPPLADRAIVARVLVGDRVSADFDAGPASYRVQDFTTKGISSFTKGYVPGPYLISLPTDANGEVELTFRLHRRFLRPGTPLRLNVEAVLRVQDPVGWQTVLDACSPDGRCVPDLPTVDSTRALTRWDLPDSPPHARGHTVNVEELIDLGDLWSAPLPGGR